MARVTVDDCLKRIPNRFQLTLAATDRARQLTAGATPQVDLDRHDKDKPTVMFFPGEYRHSLEQGASLELFGLLHDDKYYRAFNIFDIQA